MLSQCEDIIAFLQRVVFKFNVMIKKADKLQNCNDITCFLVSYVVTAIAL